MVSSVVNSGLGQVVCLFGGMFGIMLSFYVALCFIQWVSDVIDEQRWKWWI